MTATHKTLLFALTSLFLLPVAFVLPVAFGQDDQAEAPQIDEDFRADILKMLTITGADQLGEQMMEQMIQSFEAMALDVPEGFWQAFREEIDMTELIEELIPVYAANLSHEDVQAAIVFYESPAGQRIIAAQPQIMAESMAIGERWGREIALAVVAKLEEAE